MPSSTSISSRPAARGRRRHSLWLLPLEFLLLVASLYLIDDAIADLLSGARPPDYVAFMDSRAAFDAARDYDVIAIGDSYIADAFVPSAFEAQTGLSGFNFGVYNSSPFEWYYLARDLVGRGARPRYLLIGTNPSMFGQPASVGIHTIDFIRSSRVRMEMFWHAPGSESIFKAVRHRYLLNTAIKQWIGREPPMPARRIVAVDNGYLENVASMSPAEAAADEDYDLVRPVAAWGEQIRMLEQLLAFLKEQRIAPVFVSTPVHRRLLDAMERHPEYRAFRRTLATLAAAYDVPVFNARRPQYVRSLDTSEFLNQGHLQASGARRFSTDLGMWFATYRSETPAREDGVGALPARRPLQPPGTTRAHDADEDPDPDHPPSSTAASSPGNAH